MRLTLSDNAGRKFELIRSHMLPCFILMICCHDTVAGELQTQSVDANPLQLLLQQQAMDIQRQAAELTSLHSTIAAMQNIVEQLKIRADKTANDDRSRDKETCHVAVHLNSGDISASVPINRSNDTNPLQQAVQQQALDIQRQAAELKALQDTVTAQRNTVTALQDTIKQLTVRDKKIVAFTVYPSQDQITAANQGIFVFDTAVSNIENAYDTMSGIFTAPHSGTYLFLANILIPNNNNYIQIAIDKSGTLLALTHADSSNDNWDKGMCHVTVRLTAGDKVWVRHNAGLPQLTGGRWSTFSGILVHAD